MSRLIGIGGSDHGADPVLVSERLPRARDATHWHAPGRTGLSVPRATLGALSITTDVPIGQPRQQRRGDDSRATRHSGGGLQQTRRLRLKGHSTPGIGTLG